MVLLVALVAALAVLTANVWLSGRLLQEQSSRSRERDFWVLCQPGATLPEREAAFRRLVAMGNTQWRAAELRGLNLAGAALPGADLQHAIFLRANLAGANLEGARLGAASLELADLTAAKLDRANFKEARLLQAMLRGASLRGANLCAANLEQVQAQNADFVAADLSDSLCLMANLSGARLIGANLAGASLESAILKGETCCVQVKFARGLAMAERRGILPMPRPRATSHLRQEASAVALRAMSDKSARRGASRPQVKGRKAAAKRTSGEAPSRSGMLMRRFDPV